MKSDDRRRTRRMRRKLCHTRVWMCISACCHQSYRDSRNFQQLEAFFIFMCVKNCYHDATSLTLSNLHCDFYRVKCDVTVQIKSSKKGHKKHLTIIWFSVRYYWHSNAVSHLSNSKQDNSPSLYIVIRVDCTWYVHRTVNIQEHNICIWHDNWLRCIYLHSTYMYVHTICSTYVPAVPSPVANSNSKGKPMGTWPSGWWTKTQISTSFSSSTTV